jgi:hypothetical protein
MPQYLSADKEKELVETANQLMAKGKGLLAADESTGILIDSIFTSDCLVFINV